MARVLVVGEGPHDVGRREWSRQADDWVTSEGWLQPTVRRVRPSADEVAAIRLRDLVSLPRRGGPPALGGLAHKARIAKVRATTEGHALVVLATDADSTDPREHARKVAEIDAGFATIAPELLGIACVPVATSEAWLLADPDAWTAMGAGDTSLARPRPEERWGRPHDPESGHPKMVFGRLCRDNGLVDDTALRAALAGTMDLAVVARRCPTGFPLFAAALRAA